MARPKQLIKYLFSDSVAYLCPYCMNHQPGVVQSCVECGHVIDGKIDVRTTEEYRRKVRLKNE